MGDATDYFADYIRHGLSCTNMMLYGQLPCGDGTKDPVLSDFGVQQAIDLRRRLLAAGRHYDAIVTSPLRRAIETALLLFAPRDALISAYPALRRLQFGDWTAVPTIQVVPFMLEADIEGQSIVIPDEHVSVGRKALMTYFEQLLPYLTFAPLKGGFSLAKILNLLYTYSKGSRFALIGHGNIMSKLPISNKPDKYPDNTELWPLLISERKLILVDKPLIPTRKYKLALNK
jgi:hypothetical protein